MNLRNQLLDKRRIVIKIGSSSLTHKETGHISVSKMERFVRQISDIKNSGKEVILVTSGAQAVGRSALNLMKKPDILAQKQAVAAVGQASLMMLYQKLFREYNLTVGQVLITKDLIEHEGRKENAINTFRALLDYNVIPIVNENDTVSTEEIEFGDNDNLSAIVSGLVNADLLIILSDIDGLYDSDPRSNPNAQLISEVNGVDESIVHMASGVGSKVGTGGMITKLQAAKFANDRGIDMVIANSETDQVLHKILQTQTIGT
ncbi:MAG: glutamate 5-kinase, partial [Vallitaleaceae bacterium]|nr:glutamate 5-kinase [Vallitaleaceae bacterium]